MHQSQLRPGGLIPNDARAVDAAMIAHDVRAALQGVVGGVAALERASLPATLESQIDSIIASSRLLENLIAMVIGDIADPEPEHGEVDLQDLLAFLAHRWSGEAEAKGLALAVETQPDLPRGVHLQQMPLTRLIGNLLSNAIRHSDAGLVTLRVERTRAGDLIFGIHDTGPGFPAGVLERHSEVLDGSGPPSGAVHGIGLHIVRRLAAESGLTVRLGNRPEGGGEATVKIPARSLIEGAPEAAVQASGGPKVSSDLTGLSLLLAEDNLTNQMVAEQMLRSLGAEVVVASDGVEALECFEAAEFDIVVVDIEMPRLSGLDVIRSIRARDDARALTPIVALTAYALREHRDQIAQAGANGLISKPIPSIEALGRGLAEHLPGKRRLGTVETQPEAGETQPDAAPAIDRSIYEALLVAIGEEMAGELLEKVEADLDSARSELAGALDPVETGALRGASHILISVAGAVGATRLQDCARQLNTAAHAGSGPELAGQAQECVAEIEAALAFLRAERGRL
jgi:CheY-like chemotaxis protein